MFLFAEGRRTKEGGVETEQGCAHKSSTDGRSLDAGETELAFVLRLLRAITNKAIG